jgi:hypothetical protein
MAVSPNYAAIRVPGAGGEVQPDGRHRRRRGPRVTVRNEEVEANRESNATGRDRQDDPDVAHDSGCSTVASEDPEGLENAGVMP